MTFNKLLKEPVNMFNRTPLLLKIVLLLLAVQYFFPMNTVEGMVNKIDNEVSNVRGPFDIADVAKKATTGTIMKNIGSKSQGPSKSEIEKYVKNALNKYNTHKHNRKSGNMYKNRRVQDPFDKFDLK